MDKRKLDLGKDDVITDIKTAQENQGEGEIGGGVECGCGRVEPSGSTASDTFLQARLLSEWSHSDHLTADFTELYFVVVLDSQVGPR